MNTTCRDIVSFSNTFTPLTKFDSVPCSIVHVWKYDVIWNGRAESTKKEILVVGFKERTFGSSDFSAEQTLIFASALPHHRLLLSKRAHSSCELGVWIQQVLKVFLLLFRACSTAWADYIYLLDFRRRRSFFILFFYPPSVWTLLKNKNTRYLWKSTSESPSKQAPRNRLRCHKSW